MERPSPEDRLDEIQRTIEGTRRTRATHFTEFWKSIVGLANVVGSRDVKYKQDSNEFSRITLLFGVLAEPDLRDILDRREVDHLCSIENLGEPSTPLETSKRSDISVLRRRILENRTTNRSQAMKDLLDLLRIIRNNELHAYKRDQFRDHDILSTGASILCVACDKLVPKIRQVLFPR